VPTRNDDGQLVGDQLSGWVAPPRPPDENITGRHVTLEPLDRERHGAALFFAFAEAPDSLWTYMPFGPFSSLEQLASTIDLVRGYTDWQPFAVIVDDRPVGFLSYLRIDPPNGCIEIGSIAFHPDLQRTTAATEALYLLVKLSFDLGYRRCEWKCDDLNMASRTAAERLGFVYEGTFRQATHYKGRNRDTAWFAAIDSDWPGLRQAFQDWLSPENFTDGRQRRALGELTAPLRVASDPGV
jgi:RimJ/RimL family protein N-acetyltransferase